MQPIGKRFFLRNGFWLQRSDQSLQLRGPKNNSRTSPFGSQVPAICIQSKKTRRFHALVFFCILRRNSLRLSSILSSSIKFTKRFSDPLRTAFSVGCLSWSPTKTLQKTCPPKKTHLQKATMCRRWHSIYYLRTWSPSLRCPPLLWPLRRFPSDWWNQQLYIIVFTWYKPMLFGVTIILQGWPQIRGGTGTDKKLQR